MANRRIHYAVMGLGFAPHSTTNFVTVHGGQSVSINTTFNLEQIFEIGQLAIYENVEGIPDIEMQVQKVLDGYPLIVDLATRGRTSNTIAGRSNQRCNIALAVFGDTQDSASGVAQATVNMSGMYWSATTITVPAEGPATEDFTAVGNNKVWATSNLIFGSGNNLFDNTDQPLALTSGNGGVQFRENVIFGSNVHTRDANGMVAGSDATILPPDIDGISSSGTNDLTNGEFGAHLSQFTASVDLGRDNITELGRKSPYYRFVNFPVEVTCEIEVTSKRGDLVNAREDTENLTNRTIKLKMQDGTFLDLGTKNRLASTSMSGGDTSGGQVTVTYSYSNFNDFTISNNQTPS